MHSEFINRVLEHPEWDVLRAELQPEDSQDYQVRTELGGGLATIEGFGPEWSEEDRKKSEMWGEVCWYVNNGPGYCASAPEEVKVYLRRVGAVK